MHRRCAATTSMATPPAAPRASPSACTATSAKSSRRSMVIRDENGVDSGSFQIMSGPRAGRSLPRPSPPPNYDVYDNPPRRPHGEDNRPTLRRADRRRQRLAKIVDRPVRGGRASSARRACGASTATCPARGWSAGRRCCRARDPSLPAVRLHHRQERVRHRAGHRRHGPAAHRPLRRLLPGLVRQRLHPPRLRIREQGADVYGFGERKTPESFRQACRRFIYTENLVPEAATAPEQDGGRRALQPPSAAVPLLRRAIEQMETEDGWVGLGAVGQRLAPSPRTSIRAPMAIASFATWCATPAPSRSTSPAAASCASAPSRRGRPLRHAAAAPDRRQKELVKRPAEAHFEGTTRRDDFGACPLLRPQGDPCVRIH